MTLEKSLWWWTDLFFKVVWTQVPRGFHYWWIGQICPIWGYLWLLACWLTCDFSCSKSKNGRDHWNHLQKTGDFWYLCFFFLIIFDYEIRISWRTKYMYEDSPFILTTWLVDRACVASIHSRTGRGSPSNSF
jgi:hypothetical protein